jgi:hypothetical protein
MIPEASRKPNSWQHNFVLIQMVAISFREHHHATRANITRTVA